MNRSPNNEFNPPKIIDLRPQVKRAVTAWYDLTAVRFLAFLIHLVMRFFIVVVGLLYRFLRLIGLFIVDLFFGIKNIFTDIKYAGTESGLILKRFLLVSLNLLLVIPRTLVVFLKRSFNLTSKTFKQVDRGIKRETKTLVRPRAKKHSLLFGVVNFIFILLVLASPFLLYNVWQKFTPVRTLALESTKSAISNLLFGANLISQQDFIGAEKVFNQASGNFIQAQENLKEINHSLLNIASVLPNDDFRLASESKSLLAAGSLAAQIGANLASAIAPVADKNTISFLDHFSAQTIEAIEEADTLVKTLKKINSDNLPTAYRAQFANLLSQVELLGPSLQEAVDLANQAAIFLGKKIDKRYLLVFQNNSEKRGPGGFIGSFALVDFSQGKMVKLTVPKGGSYDTEAGFYKKIIAPEPLWLVQPLWHFWDANWWPDWPKSAQKLEWFYEKSDGPTVDGVISLTPKVIEEILHVHGPVDMTKDYGVIITADNFWEVVQTFSEQKPDVTKEPKKIIGDLMSKLMTDLPQDLNTAKVLALVEVLEKNLDEKHILFYLHDQSLQSSVEQFGWDGAIKNTNQDYLLVTSTNIGGQKSDRAIKEDIKYRTEVLPDGQIIANLTISRQHTAYKNQPFIGVRNVSWMRIYVPQNSQLISSSGWRQPEQSYFEEPESNWQFDSDLNNERQAKVEPISGTKIYEENNKTVLANWSMVDPGQTIVLELKYRLPFTLTYTETPKDLITKIKNYFSPPTKPSYSLLVQKQPGATQTTFTSDLVINQGWQSFWHYPNDLQVTNQGWSITRALETDLYFIVLFDKK